MGAGASIQPPTEPLDLDAAKALVGEAWSDEKEVKFNELKGEDGKVSVEAWLEAASVFTSAAATETPAAAATETPAAAASETPAAAAAPPAALLLLLVVKARAGGAGWLSCRGVSEPSPRSSSWLVVHSV